MAIFTVNTLSDDAQSGTTLREAVASANASGGADVIQFASAIQGGTVQLSDGQIEITSSLTIDGGSGITIDAQGDSRVMSVAGALQSGPLAVTLVGLTLTGGQTDDLFAGAGIASENAQLTLDNCTVSDNTATNSSAQGAGIFSTGPQLTLTNSTVSGNSLAADGGGFGAGISGDEIMLINSTVAGNTGGTFGAGIEGYSVTLIDSTVTGNSATADSSAGGGIAALVPEATLTLSNSIVAGNSAEYAADVSGSITSSNGHNIFGSDVTGNAATDLENVSTSLLFAGPLADNGGPTLTVALRDAADNPALGGALPVADITTDQRGEPRPAPAGTNPDVGAFELRQSAGGGVITGTKQGELLVGTAIGEVIHGRGGDDRILANGGADRVFGGRGDDVLRGHGGADLLQGGAGDDVLVAGPGADRMRGDAGADRFVLAQTAHASPGGPGFETILDFSRRDGDLIDLSAIDARQGPPGDQTFTLVGSHALDGAGQLRVERVDGHFLVSGSTDADAAAEFAFIVRTDLAALRAGDFIL